jgi:hypothetical protein
VPARSRASAKAEKIIRQILEAAIDPDLRDENEPAPNREVIKKTIRLIECADELLGTMPAAQVSTFFGEINITWRAGDRIVRLACFPDRPSIVQTGSVSLPIGHYESEANPTPSLLAEKLKNLTL